MRKYTKRKNPTNFLPASELKVEIYFETDNSFEGSLRARQAKAIMAQMILLSHTQQSSSQIKKEDEDQVREL